MRISIAAFVKNLKSSWPERLPLADIGTAEMRGKRTKATPWRRADWQRAGAGSSASRRASGTLPPIHIPRARDAANLSRMRSAATSRWNL